MYYSDFENDFDNLPYIKDLDPDAKYIEDIANGEYMHKMPTYNISNEINKIDNEISNSNILNNLDDKWCLACFSKLLLGYNDSDFTTEGYFKSVVKNSKKADIIKEVIGLNV
jgi:hypothetical protein